MQIAGEEIERLRRQIMEQIDLTRTVEDEEVYQLIEAQVRDFARERMLTLGEREAVVQTLFYSLRKLDAGTAGRSGNHGDHGKRCRTYLLRESGTAVQSGVRVFLQREVK